LNYFIDSGNMLPYCTFTVISVHWILLHLLLLVLLLLLLKSCKHYLLFVGRRSVSNADVEDEQFTAILTLMEILTNLLSQDFFSFAEGFACQLFSTYLVSCW